MTNKNASSVLSQELADCAIAHQVRYCRHVELLKEEERLSAEGLSIEHLHLEKSDLVEQSALEMEQENYDFNSPLFKFHPIFGKYRIPFLDQYLYNFMPAGTNVKDDENVNLKGLQGLVSDKKWRVTPGSWKNDPLETSMIKYQIENQNVDNPFLTDDEKEEAINQIRRKEERLKKEIESFRGLIKFASFVQDVSPETCKPPTSMKELVNLSQDVWCNRGFARPSMWGHYGDGGKGVCIVFNREVLSETFNSYCRSKFEIKAARVQYYGRTDRIRLGTIDLEQFEIVDNCDLFTAALKDGYFLKHEDWIAEAEYRYFMNELSNDELKIELPKNAIAAIVIGPAFELNDNKTNGFLQEFVDDYALSNNQFQINWRSGHPELYQLTSK